MCRGVIAPTLTILTASRNTGSGKALGSRFSGKDGWVLFVRKARET
jgi:hypothetical protein